MAVALCVLLLPSVSAAADDDEPSQEAPAPKEKVSLRSPDDGWFDLSAFLDTSYGFVPILWPITEPAVGYGGCAALAFIGKSSTDTRAGFDQPNITGVAGVGTENGTWGAAGMDSRYHRDTRVGGLTPSLTFDSRDSIFTPSSGTYLEGGASFYGKWLGGDADFQSASVVAMQYVPIHGKLVLGARGTASFSFGRQPFYMRPYVDMRGVPAMQYQGEHAATLEGELLRARAEAQAAHGRRRGRRAGRHGVLPAVRQRLDAAVSACRALRGR